MRKRILQVSSADMWPGITHETVRTLELSTWLSLALQNDARVAEKRRRATAHHQRGVRRHGKR